MPLLINGKGPCIYNYYNGLAKYRINYNDFLPEGKYEAFYTNGAVRTTGEYYQGEKSGVWTEFDIDGNILSQERYYSEDKAEL